VVSPILSNIYLHKLDKFVETVLIPEYTRGVRRKANPAYDKVKEAIRGARRRGDRAAVRELRKQLRAMPSGDPQDPGFRRLRYCRYADDTLLGFTGPKAEAEEIKSRLAQFLRDDLKLELSQDKTLITHGAPRGASLYPRCSWEELGGTFLGLMAYPDPKGKGNNSMPGKQRSCSGV
jgi:hypothetical protein